MLLGGWALAAAAPAQHPDTRAELKLQGAHYTVHCHFTDRAVAAEALEAAEAAWTAAATLIDLPDEPLETGQPIHLYRTPDAYRTAEAKLTQGRFARNLAFAHWATRTAHVAVQPKRDDAGLARLGIGNLTRRLIAHEATHLARFHRYPNFSQHPGWLTDGLAAWSAAAALRALDRVAAPGADPNYATHMTMAQSMLAEQRLPTAADLLADQLPDLGFYARYGLRWLWFDFLATRHREPLRALFADLRGFARTNPRRVTAALRRRLGGDAFAALDDDFRAYIEALRPRWEQRTRTLETVGAQWVQSAFVKRPAQAWRRDPTEAPPTRALVGSVELLGAGRAAARVLLGAEYGPPIALAFERGDGLRVRLVDPALPAPRLLAEPSAAQGERNHRIAFTLKRHGTDARDLRLSVADQPAVPVRLARSWDGTWGLATDPGCVTIWHDLEAR